MEGRPLDGRLWISVALCAVGDLGMSLNRVCSGRVLGRCRLAAPRLFPCLDALPGRGTAMSKAIRLVTSFDDMTVMSESVEQGGGHLGVAEYAGPFTEGQIGGDHHTGVLIEFAEQVEQQGTAGVAEGKIAKLVQDDEIGTHQVQRNAAGLALRFLAL